MYRDDEKAAFDRNQELERQLAEERKQRKEQELREAILRQQLHNQHAAPPQYGHQMLPSSNASTILVLGILGIVVCNIMGPIAWVMGNDTLRQMDAGLVDPSDRGMATAGKVCGIVGTCFLILVVFYFIFVAAAVGSASSF